MQDKRQRLDEWLLLGGVTGAVGFVLVALIEGATRPGYSWWRHYVSQLATSDQGWMQVANFIVAGLLIVGGAIGLGRSLPNERGGTWGPRLLGLFGLSLIVAGLFSTDPAMGYPADTPAKSPMTLHGLIHGLNAPVCFGLLTASAIVLGRHFLGNASSRWLGGVSLVVAAIVVLSFIGATVLSVMDETGAWPNAPTGLVQRAGIGAGWLWFAAVAIRQSRLRQQLMRRVVEVAKSSSLEWTPTR
jgi:hypothetical protein